jgi:outer membrane protein assembly factor BamB
MVESSPAVVGGLVYVGSDDGNVYCLNATNGAVVWTYTTGSFVFSSPAVVGGFVYVGSSDGHVYCLNGTSGSWVWNYTTGWFVYSSPAVVGGFVYVGSLDDNVYCLNAADGTLVWKCTTGGWVLSSPAVVNGVVFVGSEDGNVYAFGPSPLTVSISCTSATMDAGQSQLFSSTVSGGTPPYSYKWYLDGSPVGNNSTSYWYTAAEGSHEVYVNVTDSASVPVTVESNTATVTVNSAVTVSIAPTFWIMYVNQTELFTATVSGGTASFLYQWYLNGSAVSDATNATWTFAPASAGLYTVYVNVTDGVGAQVTSNAADVVVARLTPEFPSYLILPLFMMATLLAAFVLKPKRGAREDFFL